MQFLINHEVSPVKKNYYPVVHALKREDVVLTRLRIGQTVVTHSYLLKSDDHSPSISCNEPFTVKHLLIAFSDIMKRYFNVRNLKQLFKEVHVNNVLSFLKTIHPFNKV